MTFGTSGPFEDFSAAFRSLAQLPIDKIRAWNCFYRLEIGIDGTSFLFRLFHKQDMTDTGTNGIFGFTVERQQPGQQGEYVIRTGGGLGPSDQEPEVRMHRHSDTHVRGLLASSGFTPLKDFEFLADRYPTEEGSIYFTVYVARKAESFN